MEFKDFYFYCPTKMYVIENGLAQAGEIISNLGYKKLFIIYGSPRLEKTGQLDILKTSLDKKNIKYTCKGGVLPNPEVNFVKETLVELHKYQPDCLLAFGGGSVIDTVKSLANSYFYNGDPLDFNKKLVTPKKALPFGTILTIAAAGSEMSNSCVISDYETNFKSGFNSDTNRPVFSIEDASLTLSVPTNQTFAGLVDIISHSFERYFSPSYGYDLCDYFALSVIKECVDLAPILIKEPQNLLARRQLMVTSSLSHNGITSFDKAFTRFPCHMVEHKMSGINPKLAHGLGLRFLLAEFMQINKELLKDKILKFGKFIFDINSDDTQITIDKFKAFLDSLPLAKSMLEEGFSKQQEQEFFSELKIN